MACSDLTAKDQMASPSFHGKPAKKPGLVVDTLAPSYLPASATQARAADGFAKDRKNQKYSALLDTHISIPVAMETLCLLATKDSFMPRSSNPLSLFFNLPGASCAPLGS